MAIQTPYNGMLIKFRRGSYIERLPEILPKIIENILENSTVSLRSYVFFPYTRTMGSPHTWVNDPKGNTIVKALVGFTSQESEITGINGFLKEGRFFQEFDEYAAIVSEKLSTDTGIKVGDEIDLLGLKLKVVGIMNEEIEYYRDIDGSPLCQITAVLEEDPAKVQMVLLKDVVLVPYELTKELNGKIFFHGYKK